MALQLGGGVWLLGAANSRSRPCLPCAGRSSFGRRLLALEGVGRRSRRQGCFSRGNAVCVVSEPRVAENLDVPQVAPWNQAEENRFNWFQQWYPLAVPANLDKNVPTARTVLGIDVVVWWDRAESKWQVFADACPHRLAPLSEGRVDENGQLQCSYHGWTFAGTGGCTRIPQAPADGPPVHLNKRACALVYPSVEQQGMLWVWLDASQEGVMRAAEGKPPAIDVLDDPDFKGTFELTMSDMPYNYDTLVENLVDPSHIPFAHHKVLSTRDKGKPMMCTVRKVEKTGFQGQGEAGPATFMAPCIFLYQFNIPSKHKGVQPATLSAEDVKKDPSQKVVQMLFICIPVSPGHSRVLFTFPRNFFRWFFAVTPGWIRHLGNLKVLDSDLFLLHLGERKLEEQQRRGLKFAQACYTPTTSDGFVLGFRRWLNEFGGGGPTWGNGVPGTLPPACKKEQIMDRYENHVKSCKTCTRSYNSFTALRTSLQVAAFALVAFLAGSAMRSPPHPSLQGASLPLACLAVAAFLGSKAVQWFVDKYYHVHGYNHALIK